MIALPAVVASSIASKLKSYAWVLPWILTGILIYVFIVRGNPNELNQQTVHDLSVAVEKFAKASDKLTQMADRQQLWLAEMDKKVAQRDQELRDRYEEVYKRFNYDGSELALPLDALYAQQLLLPTGRFGSEELRGNEDGNSKTKFSKGSSKAP